MKKAIAWICMIALLIAMVACDSISNGEELIGIWKTSGGGFSLQFFKDGTFKITNHNTGASGYGEWETSGNILVLIGDNEQNSTYEIAGDRLIITINQQEEIWYR